MLRFYINTRSLSNTCCRLEWFLPLDHRDWEASWNLIVLFKLSSFNIRKRTDQFINNLNDVYSIITFGIVINGWMNTLTIHSPIMLRLIRQNTWDRIRIFFLLVTILVRYQCHKTSVTAEYGLPDHIGWSKFTM